MANGADCFTVDALAWEQNPVQPDQYSVQMTGAQFQALHLSEKRINKYKTGKDAHHAVWIFVDKNQRALPFSQGTDQPLQLTLRRLVNDTGHEVYRLERWQAPAAALPPQAPQARVLPSLADATDANALLQRLQGLVLEEPSRMQQLQFYMARMQFFMGEVNAAAAEIFKLVTQQ